MASSGLEERRDPLDVFIHFYQKRCGTKAASCLALDSRLESDWKGFHGCA